MERTEFEALLDMVVAQLENEARSHGFSGSAAFEDRVRGLVNQFGAHVGLVADSEPHPHVFPDVVAGEYGVEVKFTVGDSWRSVANSVFESTRSDKVRHVYVVFGKMGGEPSVRWGRYEDCVMHVRTSHVPRFEVQMYPEESLFDRMGVSYEEFRSLDVPQKMRLIREYAASRLRPGEHLWWMDDRTEGEHSLPLEARLYMNLPQEEKRRLRAEAALLCPQVVKGSRKKRKYEDAVSYLLTVHGVLCPQARDLFSAGSVALRSNPEERGGNYILRALKDIEEEMRLAADALPDSLFVEYWGHAVAKDHRLAEWLRLADGYAEGWVPSRELFQEGHGSIR